MFDASAFWIVRLIRLMGYNFAGTIHQLGINLKFKDFTKLFDGSFLTEKKSPSYFAGFASFAILLY